MVRHPDLCPLSVEEDAFRFTVPKRADCVGHEMQNPVLIVLPGQEHREHEQAPECGELRASRVIATGPVARHH